MTTQLENGVGMTRATAQEIAAVVIPIAVAEHRVKRLGRLKWGVSWHDGKLERDDEYCRICPMAAYLLARDAKPVEEVKTQKSEAFFSAAARHLTIDLHKEVTREMVIGFTNAVDGIRSVTDGAWSREARRDIAVGREAGDLVNQALENT